MNRPLKIEKLTKQRNADDHDQSEINRTRATHPKRQTHETTCPTSTTTFPRKRFRLGWATTRRVGGVNTRRSRPDVRARAGKKGSQKNVWKNPCALTWIESAETTSPSSSRASLTPSFVFPVPVLPTTANSGRSLKRVSISCRRTTNEHNARRHHDATAGLRATATAEL